MSGYAELHAHTSFSFLDGASSPEEMVDEALELGLSALAITDHNGMSGVVRFARAAKDAGLPAVFGAELSLGIAIPATHAEASVGARQGMPDPPGTHLLALARDPAGYSALCAVISLAQLRSQAKGRPVYDEDEIAAAAGGRWLLLTGCRKGPVRTALESAPSGTFALAAARRALDEMIGRHGKANIAVELTYARDPLADERYEALAGLARSAGLPLVATTAAHYHQPSRRRLAMAQAAVRGRSSLDDMDGWLPAWADACLRGEQEMRQRFARYPGAVDTAGQLGADLAFDLALIAPQLPPFPVPEGHDGEMPYLRKLAMDGAITRYGPRSAATEKAYAQIEHELRIIEQLGFPGYFLVVWEIVQFCRSRGILCQGRGSAANSAVCYALGVTAVDAVKYGLLFERFLSPERDGPPDIDIDIESVRREEVIQHVYEMHGRERAAQVANVITYRPKSAVRDVARALGYSQGQQDAWSKQVERRYWSDTEADLEQKPVDATGTPPLVLELACELQDAPRHLGIHSGGMVICDRPIIEVCPVEWARMPGRTVLQWDKEDCAAIGLVKFDLLGLGMLSALRYSFEFIEAWHGQRLELYDIPADDPLVFDMMCEADTVGVFQIESRAQMATLPRLKPRNFYDLAVEIALIRPGPIQGGAVHPYLRRRNGEEAVTYVHPDLEPILAKTMGVPLFQEQLMQVAVAAAGFTPGEADVLRKAMGSKRSAARMEALRERLYSGMAAKGIVDDAADTIFGQLKAFADFGFPESHSISFAFLANASSWLKLYHPAPFLAALLNAQPMGFYSPQSLVHDARRHGVVVHGVDINLSPAKAGLEADSSGSYAGPGPAQPAVRLGLASVRSVGDDLAERIVAARDADGPFETMTDLSHRVGLSSDVVEALATSGAFDGLGLHRREALWSAAPAAWSRPGQLGAPITAGAPDLPEMTAPEQLVADLWSTGISRDAYPTAMMRGQLDAMGVTTAAGLKLLPDRTRVRVGGIVIHRQRPGTANGTTFINLEDETGMVNVIVSVPVWEMHRRVARDSGALLIRGMLENSSGAINVVAERIDRLPLTLRTKSRDFR